MWPKAQSSKLQLLVPGHNAGMPRCPKSLVDIHHLLFRLKQVKWGIIACWAENNRLRAFCCSFNVIIMQFSIFWGHLNVQIASVQRSTLYEGDCHIILHLECDWPSVHGIGHMWNEPLFEILYVFMKYTKSLTWLLQSIASVFPGHSLDPPRWKDRAPADEGVACAALNHYRALENGKRPRAIKSWLMKIQSSKWTVNLVAFYEAVQKRGGWKTASAS